MTDHADVAIIGAGPYALSLAAHLRPTGMAVRQFGVTMNPWRAGMPRGMFLKSQGFASNLSDPDGTHTLGAFCALTGRPYAGYGLPIPIGTFVAYGQWFQQELAPDLEQTLVTGLDRVGGRYELDLATGETVQARQVVIAAGIEHFAHIPEPLRPLPGGVCTHSSQHTDMSVLRGCSVIVVGGGQSALESAALLHENGAEVQVVMREPRVVWNGPTLPPDRPLLARLREPEVGLGSGWSTWFYSNHPALFRRLPMAVRVHRARTALGPAGASWLRGRVEGEFPVLTGHATRWAKAEPGGVRLGLTGPGGRERELTADHVIAATGFRADLRRLLFLSDTLRSAMRTVPGTAAPAVDAGYQSSVPGLYVTGPCVVSTFGPVMRFVYGADHAARTIAARLTGAVSSRRSVRVGAGR